MTHFRLPHIVLLPLFTCLVSMGCKRVTVDANDNPQGYADSQVVGSWKITSITSDKAYDWDANGVMETDVFSTYSDCEKDRLYQFLGDKNGVFKLSCNNTRNGTWYILNTLYLVWIPEGLFVHNEQLANMTSNRFNTIRKLPIGGEAYTLTSTWERQ